MIAISRFFSSTLVRILVAFFTALIFEEVFGSGWYGFTGAIVGWWACVIVAYVTKEMDRRIYLARRLVAERARTRESESFGGLTPSAIRAIEAQVARDWEDDQEDESDDEPDVDHEAGVFTIKIADRRPDPDADSEECDAWVNTINDQPFAYIRDDRHSPAVWKPANMSNNSGSVMLTSDDLAISMVVVKSLELVITIRDLMNCTKFSELKPETIHHLNSVDESNARTLCASAGFDPEEWKPTHRDEVSSGKRVIDLGD